MIHYVQAAAKHLIDLPYGFSGSLSVTSKGWWVEVEDRRRVLHYANKLVSFDETDTLTSVMDQLVLSLGRG